MKDARKKEWNYKIGVVSIIAKFPLYVRLVYVLLLYVYVWKLLKFTYAIKVILLNPEPIIDDLQQFCAMFNKSDLLINKNIMP